MTTPLGRELEEWRRLGAADTAGEIANQPAVWRQIGAQAAEVAPALRAFLDPLIARPGLRIILTGAGSSSYVGEILAPALGRRLRARVEAIATTDIVAVPNAVLAEDVPTLLVSFARSGDSPESVAAVELARRLLPRLSSLVVTCNPAGALARSHAVAPDSHVLLLPDAASDRAFAMTASVTGMVLAGLLAFGEPAEPDLIERLATAAEHALVEWPERVAQLAGRGFRRAVFLGNGSLLGAARESALKVLELAAGRTAAFAESPLGFRHGPKAVLDDDTLVVAYESNDSYTRKYDRDMVAELARTVPADRLVVVSAQPGTGGFGLPGIADVDDSALALPALLCAQLLGVHNALHLGILPDNPFPGGDLNRVVQGAIMHPLGAVRA